MTGLRLVAARSRLARPHDLKEDWKVCDASSRDFNMPYRGGSHDTEVFSQNSIGTDRSFYDLAEILICDPVASNRAATRSALYSLGCRHIEIVGSLRDFSEALENRPPDLALCEVQVGEAELCRVIRELRGGVKSYNPFLIIIATAWAPNATLTTDVLSAGADGLLLRPFSSAVLDHRVRAHVLHQKPFIVTGDYIGPERRALERPSNAFSLMPPNSLRAKIDGRNNLDEAVRRFNTELRAACIKLAAAKQRRNPSLLQD
jgi:CheY-like chemotaxis protein